MTAFGTGLPLRDVSFDGEFRRVTGPSSGIGKFLELPIEHSEPAGDVERERVHQAGWWYQEFACDCLDGASSSLFSALEAQAMPENRDTSELRCSGSTSPSHRTSMPRATNRPRHRTADRALVRAHDALNRKRPLPRRPD